MVVKDGLDNLERLYPLVKDHIDEWVIVVPPGDITSFKDAKVIVKDFTQGIETKYIERMKELGLNVPKDYRLFNFAAARNEALKAATGDYVLWLDADDEPVGMDNIKKFIEQNPATEAFHALYDYGHDEEGNPIADQIRERVVLNNGRWEWLGAKLGLIHETLLPVGSYRPLMLDFPEDIFRVEHHSDHMDESSIRNHVALLYEYLKTNGEDPRTTYYLGIEFFNRRMYDYCIKVLLEYVKVGGSEEDLYHAWLKIAEAYHMLKDSKSGRDAYLRAMDIMPHRPDSYLGLGESYHDQEEWAKSTEYIMTGLQKKLPVTKHAVDKIKYTFRPSGYVALNYLQLGKPKDAYEWFIRAAKINPKHPWILDNVKLFQDAQDLNDYVASFVKLGQISQRLYPQTLSKLTEIIPDNLKDQELLMDFRWRYATPKIWGEKSIVFFCSAAFEDWGPESLVKGCGGSEEAIIQLTKRLAALGWDVTVYNNCVKESIVDGVKWVRYERFNPRDMFNIIVSWRNNLFLSYPITAMKKIVDMHDTPEPNLYQPEDMKDVTIFVKSKYHRTWLPNLPDEKFVIIPNGVDLSKFPKTKKTNNNLVWTSSYDRGLENLLNMWQGIIKAVPEATLDVYYGWELYDSTPWGKKPSGQAWKDKIQQLLQQNGITEHGRVGSDEIAQAYLKADVWAYPTEFPEIDCITATKAMAARCVPITTDFAAMQERNQGVMVKTGDWGEFEEKLISLLKDEEGKKDIRAKLDVSKFSWDEVAKQWDKEFNK